MKLNIVQIISISIPLLLPLSGSGAELGTAQTCRVEWAPSPSGPVGRQHREGYPISSEVYTTRQRTIVPDSVTSDAPTFYPWDPSQFEENGYGLWHYGSGIDYGKDPRIMPVSYNVSFVTNAASLLSFFTMTDTHAPARRGLSKAPRNSGYGALFRIRQG